MVRFELFSLFQITATDVQKGNTDTQSISNYLCIHNGGYLCFEKQL